MPFASVFTVVSALAEATASFPSSHGAAAAAVAVNDRAIAVVVIVAVVAGSC